MKTLNLIFIAFVAFGSSACSTMYFHNGTGQMMVENEEWHHDGILRLVEFSSPVDMNDRCEGKEWSTIKNEKTFVQGLVGALTYGIYDPWQVEYACASSK
jgi:hypothetical protein